MSTEFGPTPPEIDVTVDDKLPSFYDPQIIMGHLWPVIRLAERDISQIEGIDRNMTPGERRLFLSNQLPQDIPRVRFANMLFSYFLQQDEDLSLTEYLDAAADKFKLSIDEPMKLAMESKQEIMPVLEVRSSDVVSSLEIIMEGKPDHEYILLNMLAAPSEDIVDSKQDRLLQDLVILGAHFESTDFYGELAQKLDSGEYDTYMAKDILVSVVNAEECSIDQKTYQEMQKMVDLAAKMTPGASKLEIIEKLSERGSIELWPAELQKAFSKHRSQLASKLQRRLSYRKIFLTRVGYIHERTDEKRIAQFVRENPDLSIDKPQLTKAEQVRNNVESKKRRRTKGVGGAAVQAAKNSHEKAKLPPREVGMIDKNGNTHSLDSDTFKKLVGEYTEEYLGTDLTTTIEQAIAYLQDANSSNGLTRGVRPLTDSAVSIGPADGMKEKYRVFRMRPDQIAEIDTPNRLASKMRIYFIFDKADGNKIWILGIQSKDNSRRFYRSFGLGMMGDK